MNYTYHTCFSWILFQQCQRRYYKYYKYIIMHYEQEPGKVSTEQNTVSKVSKTHEVQTTDDALQRSLLTKKQVQRCMCLCK